jgi:hypothetical protein
MDPHQVTQERMRQRYSVSAAHSQFVVFASVSRVAESSDPLASPLHCAECSASPGRPFLSQ